MSPGRPSFLAKAGWPSIVSGLFLGLCAMGTAAGYYWLTPGKWGRPSNVASALFRWDAGWYLHIATVGYQWSPRAPSRQFDVAFFPLWPLVDATARCLGGGTRPVALIASAVAFGILSIFAFYHLARRLLPESVVPLATAGYAFYPGASFFVNSYPVSLLNLLLILMLLCLLEGRIWRAAALAGLATAAGPLAVGMALAVPLSALDRGMRLALLLTARGLRESLAAWGVAAGTGLTSIAGLLGFMAYQTWRFGTPTAFLVAQRAWGYATIPIRVIRAVTLYPLTHLPGYPGLHPPGPYPGTQFEMWVQGAEGVGALLLCLVLILAQARRAPWPFTASALVTVLAFYWFSGTLQGPPSAMRELYLAIPAFIGLGVLAERHRTQTRVLVVIFAALLCSQVALTVAGYWVV